MRFGEFLIDAGVIDASTLLSALAEQQRRRAFLPKLAVELGYMNDKTALEVMDEATDCHERFLFEAQENGMLNRLTATDLLDEWRRTATPIGEMLVELGHMTETSRKSMLRRFDQTRQT